MFDFRIQFDGQTTRIVVRQNVLKEVGQLIRAATGNAPPSFIFVVTDSQVGPRYGRTVSASLDEVGLPTHVHTVEAGEASKNLAELANAYIALADHNVARDALILALGGGVVSDLAGFVAGTWMRGVRFAICSTTLEADVDASIGGKTGVNIAGGKNLVGVFHQPILVVVDPVCLQSLDKRDVRAGLAESVKHALISSPEFLSWHEENIEPILQLDEALLTELIQRNIKTKADIVARDATEQVDVRVLLNFGHTVGHAIEEGCGYTLRHGECVSLGILAACRLSRSCGLFSDAGIGRVEALLARIGLPTRLPQALDIDRIIATMHKDKKIRDHAVRFVLLEDIGKPTVRNDVTDAQVREVYQALLP
ncbi:MAG: 3-dehydroquinate synthase [Phycisphaerales bacterium]|nr:MAG: 3-dehydroquinate synthase [Phycisphaerales bacterium]